MMLRPGAVPAADKSARGVVKFFGKDATSPGGAVFDYFSGEIDRSDKRALELIALSKQNARAGRGKDYLKQAQTERRRNAKWAFWHALQFPDETNRSAACAVAIKLLEKAYPSRSAVGFAMRHPFISDRISMLRAELDSCAKTLRRA